MILERGMIIHNVDKGVVPPAYAHEPFEKTYERELIGMIATVETSGYITINYIKNDKDKDWFSAETERITREQFDDKWTVVDIKE